MSTDESAFVNVRVLFKKRGEGLDISNGTLELYDDSVLLKRNGKRNSEEQ